MPLHPINAVGSIYVTVLGILICLMPLHPEKVFSLIVVTPSGIRMEFSAAQPPNALAPRVSRVAGNVICPNDVQPANAPLSICLTLDGISMLVNLLMP